MAKKKLKVQDDLAELWSKMKNKFIKKKAPTIYEFKSMEKGISKVWLLSKID